MLQMNCFPCKPGMRGSMQQGWMMNQGAGRMFLNMNPVPPARGGDAAGSRAMVNVQMMGNGAQK